MNQYTDRIFLILNTVVAKGWGSAVPNLYLMRRRWAGQTAICQPATPAPVHLANQNQSCKCRETGSRIRWKYHDALAQAPDPSYRKLPARTTISSMKDRIFSTTGQNCRIPVPQ